ncbi:MAG: 3-keto-disaccharide hydrolase [Planctomycetota bacterium]|jgi:hypothetical protein
MRTHARIATALLIALASAPAYAQGGKNPFLGAWDLTLPNGKAGWLNVTQEKGYLDAQILWGGGSVVPVSSVYVDGDTLVVTRTRDVPRKEGNKTVRTQQFTETITAKRTGAGLALTQHVPNRNGKGAQKNALTGKRNPKLPKRPNLSKVKYGKPVKLFNGKNLNGWELLEKDQPNGWSAKNGILDNNPVQHEGQPKIRYANLRTVDEFEDFRLTLEARVPEGGNSGVYLRGVYEIQVFDSYGRERDSHHMGALYSRITPAVAAEKPAGQWQTMEMILVDRHITVVLNGKTVIDNQPALGCTGGALWSDTTKPGPIYLQGDHAAIEYRNMVLTPIVK